MEFSILTSGIGFGTYIPAVVLAQQLKSTGAGVSVDILEKLFLDEKKDRLVENQKRYHDDFNAAKVAMRIPAMKQQGNYDEERIQKLLWQWDVKGTQFFIVFSGSWQDILAEYGRTPKTHIYCVHMDCVVSPSWKGFSLDHEGEAWLIGKGDGFPETVLYPEQQLPLDKRGNRLLVHGGGWGLGLSTVRENLAEASGYGVYLVDSFAQDGDPEGVFTYFSTGEWHAYEETGRVFPPLYYEGKDINRADEHYIYKLEKEAVAVISKAGGGTLCESFSGCVPMILTESAARHEEMNKMKWIRQGFGISFEEWSQGGFSRKPLEECYQRLHTRIGQAQKVLFQEIRKWACN